MLLNGEQKHYSYIQKHDESESFMFKKKKKTANDTYPWFHLIWNSQVGKTSVWQEKPKTTIVAYERAGVRFAGKGHGAASWVTGNVFILLEVWVTHFFPLLNLVEWCI